MINHKNSRESKEEGKNTRGVGAEEVEESMALKEDFNHFHFHLSLYFLIMFFSPASLLIQAKDLAGKASRDGNQNYI